MQIRLSIVVFVAALLPAQQLPEGPGRAETEKLCKQCHELARSISLRQDRTGWTTTLVKMTAFGMKATDQETAAVLDYLAKHYPADDLPPIHINKAKAIELESALSLRRSQAKAFIEYRDKNGGFHSIDDLKKAPGIDPTVVEEKKQRIVF